MVAILLTAWLSATGPWEDRVFPVVDAIELSLTPKAYQYRVGGLFVVGNARTDISTILNRVPLYPGGRLCRWRVLLAEHRLARLGLFEVDPKRRLRPRVTAMNAADGSRYKDIKVEVVELKPGSQ